MGGGVKPLLLFLGLTLPCLGQLNPADQPFAATPAPAPAQVVLVQPPAQAPPVTDWVAKIYLWGGILTTALTVFAGVAVFALRKAAEVKPYFDALKPRVDGIEARQDRQAQKTGQLQNQVVDLAKSVPTSPEAAAQPPPPPAVPPAALVVLLCFWASALVGCSTPYKGPPVTVGLNYTDAQGRTIGTSVKIDESTRRDK